MKLGTFADTLFHKFSVLLRVGWVGGWDVSFGGERRPFYYHKWLSRSFIQPVEVDNMKQFWVFFSS